MIMTDLHKRQKITADANASGLIIMQEGAVTLQ